MTISSRLDCAWDEPHCTARLSFINTGPRGGSANDWSHHGICLHLPLYAGLLSILVQPLTELILRGFLAESGGWDSWIFCGRCHSDFRDDGGYVLPSLWSISESVADCFPELSRVKVLVRKVVGPPEPRVLVCRRPGGCFYGSSRRRKHQSLSWESVCNNSCSPKPVSDTSKSVDVAFSSAGVKMQGEEK